MSEVTSIEVVGLKELVRALRILQDKQLQNELKQAHRNASIIAARFVQREAPVRTGRLALSTRAKPTQREGRVSIGTPVGVPYAGPVIWGDPSRNIRGNPYPFRAIDKGEKEIVRAYEEEVDNILKKAGLR